MSQGSPSKQDRIEKHLARQRGAGVRDLATSFGFSFGFQPSAIEQQDNNEPPAKRRKSAHSHDTKTLVKPIVQPERDSDSREPPKTQRTAAKRKQPRRFEVASDDEKSNTAATEQLAEQNDSFLLVKKPAGKRGRPQKIQPATRDGDVEAETARVTVGKRGRPRKVGFTTDQAKPAGVVDSEEVATHPAKSMKKRGRPPKPLVTAEPEASTHEPDFCEPTTSASMAVVVSERRDLSAALLPVKTSTADEQVKPAEKKRGRPRTARTESTTPDAKDKQGVTSNAGSGDLPKAKTTCQTHYKPERPIAQPTQRPRRQAAATAISKVSKGFIEEEAPIDKKRRDPDLEPSFKRGRKKMPPSAILSDASGSKTKSDTATPETAEDNGHEASNDLVCAAEISCHELPTQPQVLTETKKKPTRHTVLADPVSEKVEHSPDAIPVRKHRVSKRVPLSETHTNIALPTPSPEKRTKDTKEVARQGARNRSIDVERTLRTTSVVPSIQHAQVAVDVLHATKSRVLKPAKQTTRKEPQHEESLQQKSGCYPEAFASGFTDPTKHAVSGQELVVDERSKRLRIKAKPAPTTHQEHLPGAPGRRREIQEEAEPVTSAAASSKQTGKRSDSRKTNTTSREDDHKVDWLFETANSRQLPPAKEKKKALSKRRRERTEDTNEAEMDLDDLLSNIASFVPKGMRA